MLLNSGKETELLYPEQLQTEEQLGNTSLSCFKVKIKAEAGGGRCLKKEESCGVVWLGFLGVGFFFFCIPKDLFMQCKVL